MSTLNLALQNVSLMREKMDDNMERDIITAIRTAIVEKPELGPAVKGSVAPVIDLLNDRFA